MQNVSITSVVQCLFKVYSLVLFRTLSQHQNFETVRKENMKFFLKWIFGSFPLLSACFNMQPLNSKQLTIMHFYNLHQDWVDYVLKEFPKKRNYYNRPADQIFMTRKVSWQNEIFDTSPYTHFDFWFRDPIFSKTRTYDDHL